MRAALGLRSDGSRMPAPSPARSDRMPDHGSPRRHRFVQEGEVPVEVLPAREHGRGPFTPGNGRARVDDSALMAERSAREQAERAVADAAERVRELQTKLGHTELARDEALAVAAARSAQVEALEAQLREAAAPPPKPRKATAPKSATPRPRGRQPAPKPVKWWIRDSPRTT